VTDALFGASAGGVIVACVWGLLRLLANHRRPAIAPPPGAEVVYLSLTGRIEELEDKYNRLDRRFTRIQGEFNAYTRVEAEDEPLPEEE